MWSDEIMDIQLKTDKMKSQSRLGTSRSKAVLDLINQAGTNDFEAVRQLKKHQSSKMLASVTPTNYSTEDL